MDSDFSLELNGALKAVQEGRVSEKSPDSLRSGLQALQKCYMSQDRSPPIKAAIESFENEISRRSQQEGAKTLHQLSMEQGGKFHKETMGEFGELKTLVGRLARPRWIDWAILIAGVIAAIGVVVSLFLIH